MTTSNYYTVVPPPNFSYIEDTLCRCHHPLLPSCLSFLRSNAVGCIVNISLKTLDPQIVTYCTEVDITIVNAWDDPPIKNGELAKFESWIANCINILMNHSASCNTLLVGSSETLYDCLVIGCLRRVQEWSFTSILSEFRQLCWPLRLNDFEQFIESFNVSLIVTEENVPDYLLTHDHLKGEEVKLIQRHTAWQRLQLITAASNASADPVKDTEIESESILEPLPPQPPQVSDSAVVGQAQIDDLLIKLLFNGGNVLISPTAHYDPNISLINDKDEDD